MKAKMVVQVILRSPNKDGGYAERVCFVDNARVKVGSQLTLTNAEDPKRRWEVVEMHADMSLRDLHTDWHAGGL